MKQCIQQNGSFDNDYHINISIDHSILSLLLILTRPVPSTAYHIPKQDQTSTNYSYNVSFYVFNVT